MTEDVIESDDRLSLIDKLELVDQVGMYHIKGYSVPEISSLMDVDKSEVREMIDEYRLILNRQAESDPYFLERVQLNTIKALNEFDEIGKESWETVSIATDHGMVSARIQALKLCTEVAHKKAQLHQLMNNNQTDVEYVARMQRAESVNALLSKIVRDVIAQYPDIRDKVQRDLAEAFEVLDDGVIDMTDDKTLEATYVDEVPNNVESS
ncbi:hypothetical protein CL620_00920 [archaeon]|jgi:hypothetical protein|nr:hypothetical protein [archaeon]|tara:strand:+ start:319 stop:945 length:627 start_codon:yes stop_codon:yes gene_type:complete